MPLLHFARYREIAEELAACSDPIIAASSGLISSIQFRAASAAGRPVSLRIATLESFARRVLNDCGEYPHPAGDFERHLAMRAAVQEIDDPMSETRGIVAMMERSYRDVRDSGITLREFEKRAGGRGHTAVLATVWHRYEDLISSLQAVDSADILLHAAEKIEAGCDIEPQIVAGFYDMTGAQLRLLRALEKSGKLMRIMVPIGESEAYGFASRFVSQLKSSLIPQAASIHIKSTKPVVEASATNEHELRGVCASIRALLDGGTPAAQIGITARSLDSGDLRLLQRFAAENGFGITARIDLALSAQRIGRGVAAILRLADRNFARADVIDILRDGYKPERPAQINALDIATRRARISGGPAANIRNPNNDSAIEDYRAVVAELASLPHRIDWIASKFRVDTGLDLAALEALDEIAALVRRWKRPVDRDTILELIEMAELRQPSATDLPLIWTGDAMKFRGRAFEHLFVVRAQEATLPQRRLADPLLPDHDRRELKIREIGDGRDEERLLFQLLLDSSSSVRFSYATSDAFGKTLRPSRMIRGFATTETKPAASRTAHGVNLARQRQIVDLAGSRSAFDGYLDEKVFTLISNKLQTLSPTQLENFGECPQKFLLKAVFDVRDYADPNRELQMPHLEKGRLDHTILERFYSTLDRFPPADIRAHLDPIVDQAFDEEESRVPAFNRVMRMIERRATKRHLQAFLSDDIDETAANNLQPKHFEYEFGPEPFVMAGHEVPITLKGIVDRIDAGGDLLRIVDYKSGKAERYEKLSEKIERGVRLQLAFYAIAVADIFGTRKVSGAIKPLMPGSKRDTMTFDLGASERAVRETLDLFLSAMRRGVFPAVPDEEACKYCPVKLSCRTKHSDHERRALRRYDDPRALLESLA